MCWQNLLFLGVLQPFSLKILTDFDLKKMHIIKCHLPIQRLISCNKCLHNSIYNGVYQLCGHYNLPKLTHKIHHTEIINFMQMAVIKIIKHFLYGLNQHLLLPLKLMVFQLLDQVGPLKITVSWSRGLLLIS